MKRKMKSNSLFVALMLLISITTVQAQSNTGKMLYEDGECNITVYLVDFTEDGVYRIHFRSHGNYNINTAKLVSGITHYNNESRYFLSDLTAKMNASYGGKTYECNIMGTSGINYKDGDMWSYYIFSDVLEETPEFNGGNVILTVTDLCNNVWSRK